MDHAGIVYFARVFHYFHLAYEDFFHSALGVPFQDFFEESGVLAPVVHTEADLKSPLLHGREYEIETWISRLGQKSWTFQFRVGEAGGAEPRAQGGEEPATHATGELVFAFASKDNLESMPIPEEWRRRVEEYCD